MADNESLESKYGRRKTSQSNENVSTNENNENNNKENDIYRYSRNQEEKTNTLKQHLRDISGKNIQNPKKQIIFTEEIKKKDGLNDSKEIKRDIEDALSQYKANTTQYINQTANKPQETKLVKILKTIVSTLIFLVVLCIIVAIFMKPKINMESGEIIDQINNAEAMYYTMYKKYYYFSKTNYDSTLGIDMSIYNYFDSYEVLHNDETGNYEIKLYGATNAFTIVYYTIKSYIS